MTTANASAKISPAKGSCFVGEGNQPGVFPLKKLLKLRIETDFVKPGRILFVYIRKSDQ